MEKKNIKNSCRKFIEKNERYSRVFELLPDDEKNWVLDYPCEGKGVTQCEKVKTYEGLDAAPEEEIFSKNRIL